MEILSNAFSLYLNEKKEKAIELLRTDVNPECEFALGVLSLFYGINPSEGYNLTSKNLDYIRTHQDQEECFILLVTYYHVTDIVGDYLLTKASNYLSKHKFKEEMNKLFLTNTLLSIVVNRPKLNRKKAAKFAEILKAGLKKENFVLAQYYFLIDEDEKSNALLKNMKSNDAQIEKALHIAITDKDKCLSLVESLADSKNFFAYIFLARFYIKFGAKYDVMIKNLMNGLHLGHPIFAKYIFNMCEYNPEFIKKYDIETILKAHVDSINDNYYFLAKIAQKKGQETSYLRYLNQGVNANSYLAKKELLMYYLEKEDSINALKFATEEREYHPSLLAYFYLHQVEVDYPKVFALLDEGTEKNDMESYFILGKLYLLGQGTEKQVKKGIEYLETLDNKDSYEILRDYYSSENNNEGYYDALDTLCGTYDNSALLGFGKIAFDGLLDYSEEKVESFFTLASSSSNKEANLYLAIINEERKDYKNAKKYYEASLPLKEAYRHYANFLMEVKPSSEKTNKAIALLETAGEQGDKNAYNTLSYLYYKGEKIKRDAQKSFDYLQKCIDLPVAKHNLAYFYLNGDVVEKDVDKALELLNTAAEEGYISSYNSLGELYLDNRFIEKDYVKARSYFTKAAEKGNTSSYLSFPECLLSRNNEADIKTYFNEIEKDLQKALECKEYEALLLLGKLHASKLHSEKHFKLAVSYFEKAKEKFPREADEELGDLYFLAKDYKKSQMYYQHAICFNSSDCIVSLAKAYVYDKESSSKGIEMLEGLAQGGNEEACFTIGRWYIEGKNVKADKKKGLTYLEKAARKKYLDAYFFLGELYLDGKYVDVDYVKARKYFELGAKMNHAPCINCLGVMCSNEKAFTKKESQNYLSYFKAAALLEFPVGMYNYAVSLVNEGKTKQDIDKAINILLEVVGFGLKQAYVELANIYISNEFDKQDTEKALYYYDLALKAGISDASYQLGVLYLQGEEIEKDVNKAIEYFKIASSKKHPMALFSLGCMYYYGTSGKIDLASARKCFEQGAELDMPDCYYYLGVMYRDGIGVKKNRVVADTYFMKAEELGKDVIDERDYKYAA